MSDLSFAIASDLSFHEGEGLENIIIFISLPFKKHLVTSIESKGCNNLFTTNRTLLTRLFPLTSWLFQVDILLATGILKTRVVGSADLKPTFESLSTVALLCRIPMELLVKQLQRTNKSWAVIRNRNKQGTPTVIRTVIKIHNQDSNKIKDPLLVYNHNSSPTPQFFFSFLKEIK